MQTTLPIAALIDIRCRELALKKSALVQKMGYGSIAKGLKRLEQICEGDFKLTAEAILRLPKALELPPTAIRQAVEATRVQIAAEIEAQEREAFHPHGIILTKITVPRPIFIAALTDIAKWKRIDLNVRGTETFLDQAMTVVRNRSQMFGGSLPMFGAITGFVVRSSFDFHVRYDVEGREVQRGGPMNPITEPTWDLGRGKPLSTVIKL